VNYFSFSFFPPDDKLKIIRYMIFTYVFIRSLEVLLESIKFRAAAFSPGINKEVFWRTKE